MREIKFRYLYGVDEKAGPFFTKVFTLNQIEGGDQFDEISDNPLLKNHRILHRDQFTGLLDKNGKEIYSDDICRRDGCDWIAPIEFHDGAFWVGALLLCMEICELEVIGNIHENYELLTT
jgi:hypothetical protein